jgi:hypothetical protein
MPHLFVGMVIYSRRWMLLYLSSLNCICSLSKLGIDSWYMTLTDVHTDVKGSRYLRHLLGCSHASTNTLLIHGPFCTIGL